MVAEPAVAQAANRPFIPMAEGLGPEELYYCQVEAMLGTLLGRLLVMGLYCLLIAGWQGALLGMALLLVLGWGQILRHKDRPDLLRRNRNRYIWAVVALAFGPLLIRLVYAVLQAWAPSVLDAWLSFTAPMVEHLGRHLPTFDEMRQAHAKRFAASDPVKAPHIDLALNMQMLHWLSLPSVFLFAPLLACNWRMRSFTRKEQLNLAKAILAILPFIIAGFYFISQIFRETTNLRYGAIQFSIDGALHIQLAGFLLISLIPLGLIFLISIVFKRLLGEQKIKGFILSNLRAGQKKPSG